MLLFVGYQLWGTGLQHSQAQGSLEDDFLELLESDVAAEAQAPEAAPVEEDPAGQEADEAGEQADPDQVDDENAEPSRAELVQRDFDDVEYSAEFVSKLYPDAGNSLARIVIPDINVDQIVVEGVSVEDLRKGPGHYRQTPNPGQAGNAAIAGHRTTYGAPFHRVDELEPGAVILVTTLQGTFEYRVRGNEAPDGTTKGHFIVAPSQVEVLHQTGENLLTLTACHPKYSARQRIIVQAELVGEPAPTIPRDGALDLDPVDLNSGAADERAQEVPGVDQVISDEVAADDDPSVDADGNPVEGDDSEANANGSDDAAEAEDEDEDEDDIAAAASAVDADDSGNSGGETAELTSENSELTVGETPSGEAEDFGEGLNGDRSKIKPAVMWGLAGGFIWLAAWFIGQRLNRKWTLYTVGLAPFALVLWACFVNVDQALPSY